MLQINNALIGHFGRWHCIKIFIEKSSYHQSLPQEAHRILIPIFDLFLPFQYRSIIRKFHMKRGKSHLIESNRAIIYALFL
jgi:hypothetical protein